MNVWIRNDKLQTAMLLGARIALYKNAVHIIPVRFVAGIQVFFKGN